MIMVDKIKVISQSTHERRMETVDLFNKIKPFLDEGFIYSSAVARVILGEGVSNNNLSQYAWYKELVEYGESQGYSYVEYSGKGHQI